MNRVLSWLTTVTLTLIGTQSVLGQTGADVDAAVKRGRAFVQKGYHGKGIAELQNAVELAKRAFGADHANVHRARHNLALAYAADSQYAVAAEIFRDSRERLIAASAARKGNVTIDELANLIFGEAEMYFNLGQFGKAESLVLDAKAICDRTGWTGPANMAQNNLANIWRMKKERNRAIEEYMRVLKFRVKQFGPKDTRCGDVLGNVGTVFYDMKAYKDAEQLFRQCLEISEAERGKDGDPMALANWGMSLEALGRYDEAEQCYQRYLRLAETKYHLPQSAADARAWLASVAAHTGRGDEAVKLMDQSRRELRPLVSHVASGLSDSEQMTYLTRYTSETLSPALSLGWHLRDNSDAVEKSAAWLLNAQGMLYEAMAERALLARDARISSKGADAEELAAVRRQIASRVQHGPGEERGEEHARTLTALYARETELARRIGLASKREAPRHAWVELAEVRKAIPADAVFISIARLDLLDYSSKGGPNGPKIEPHYVAWILPPDGNGKVQIVRLGSAKDVDAAMRKLMSSHRELDALYADIDKQIIKEKIAPAEQRKRFEQLRSERQPQFAKLEKTYREVSAADMSRLVLHPLLQHIGKAKRWLLAPDGDLWHVPWSALVLPSGQYVLEQFSITHVVSGRDLVAAPGKPVVAGPPLVMSAPNYNLGRKSPKDGVERASLLVGFGKEWLAKLLPDFEKAAQAKAAVFVGDEAREEVIRAAKSPRLILLVTHGVFAKVDPNVVRPGFGFFDENPLLRAQLTLAGCNRRHYADEKDDDGWLHGSEVLDCDLRGTELVMLTACQTGLGDVHGGQSAAGMRQAFQLAGARSVIATLWSVDQKASQRLTEDFFAQLAQGKSAAEALREAQQMRRRDPAHVHPFYWAAFTITSRSP